MHVAVSFFFFLYGASRASNQGRTGSIPPQYGLDKEHYETQTAAYVSSHIGILNFGNLQASAITIYKVTNLKKLVKQNCRINKKGNSHQAFHVVGLAVPRLEGEYSNLNK